MVFNFEYLSFIGNRRLNSKNQYQCNLCKILYNSQGVLNRHQKYYCCKEKTCVCSYCDHRTYEQYHMDAHIRRKHQQ